AGARRVRRDVHPAAAGQAPLPLARRPARPPDLGAGARRAPAVRDDAHQPDHRGPGGMSSRPTPEQPWPVRTVARKIAEWVDRLGAVWVEGQLAPVTGPARP